MEALIRSTAQDREVQELLAQYECPIPFHEVRTRFIGSVAMPFMTHAPLNVVKDLWNGKLPEFPDVDHRNEFMGALISGLWLRLSQHQNRNSPFRLCRMNSAPTRNYISILTLMRRQEIDGFICGLFRDEKSLDLPEKASRNLDILMETHDLFSGIEALTSDRDAVFDEKRLRTTLRNTQDLTLQAERAIHTLILAYVRARKFNLPLFTNERADFQLH